MASVKFLDFLVSYRGIEVDPAQIKVIEDIPDMLTSKKNVQILTGRIATLGQFISRSSEQCQNYISILKKQKNFESTLECQQTLRDLKSYLLNPPLMSKPHERERLLLYLVVSEVSARTILV